MTKSNPFPEDFFVQQVFIEHFLDARHCIQPYGDIKLKKVELLAQDYPFSHHELPNAYKWMSHKHLKLTMF